MSRCKGVAAKVRLSALILLVLAFSPYSCDLFNAGLGNKVDINPPEVRITSPENNAYIGYSGEGLVVRGTASDDLGLKSVTLSWDGGSREAVVSGQKWAVTFTPDAPLPDGRYVFTARATDGSKKISEWQSTVNVDSKPPLVDVIFDSDRGKSIANAFNGIDTIRGIADDGTGRLASVLVSLGGVQIFPNAANPNPSISELNSWQALVDFTGLKGKTGSWVNAVSSPVSGSTSDELVSAILHVDALDAAGNTASNEWTVYVDSSFDMPRVTYSGIFNTSIPFPRNPLIHHENIFRENDVFEFTVSDDDAVDRASAKLTILKKDAPIGDTLVYTVASGGLGVSPNSSEASKQARFSFTIPTGWLGEYSLRFEVSDSAEAKASMPVSVYTSSLVSIVVDSGTVNLDLTATPSPIVKPAELLIEGDATHLLGITSVILNLKDEGTGISTPYPLSLVGNHFSWTETGLEGVYSAKIVATSTTGKFADRTVNFTVDGTAPSIAFNAVGPIVAPNKVNGRLRASVTASDLNGLAGVRYWVLSDPAAPLASWTWASPSFVSLASAPYEAVIDTTALSGSKILRFGALDKAGNVNFIDYAPLSVDQNSDNPRIDITNLNASVGTFAGAVTNLLESNARIIGSLSDDDGIASGAVQLRYTPSLASAASPLAYGAWIPLASTSTSFDYGFPPAVSEGVHAFEITVQDNAAQKDGFPAVSTTIGPVFIAIDRSAPTLTVTSPTIDSYKGLGDFSITGTAFDQNGIKNINSDAGDVPDVVVRTINNDFSDTLNNIYVAVDGGGNWSYTFTVPAGADYSQTFYLMTQDKFNKQTVVTHRIKFDTVAPTLTILAPADGAWVSGSTLNISGTASDGVGSGVKNIYWWVGDAAAIPPDTISNLAAWNGLSGGSTWAALVDLAAMAAEGSKKLHVFATDNAGNSSQLLSPVVRAFGLDRSAPSVTETTVGITPVDKKDAFSFNGVFSDTNAISSAVITQQKDGGAINEIVNLPGLSGTSSAWSLSNLPRDPTNLPNLLVDDGNYVYEIKVSDIAGKATTLTRNVRIDTKPPNILSITAPLAGQVGLSALSGTTYRFQGSASDEVSGMKKLYYFISASSTPPADSSGYDFLNIGNGTWSFIEDFDIDGLGPDTGRAEGTWYLHVLSEDAAGNQTPAAVSVLFDIDHANPTLTETAINTASVTARGSGFSLSGTSADTHGIQSIAISQSKDGGPALGITPNGPSGTTSWNLANLPRAVGDLGNQALVDGVYTYVVTATDLSGKTTSLTRTVQLDTTPPDLVVTAPVNGGSVDTQTYTLRGTATEIGGVGFNPASDVEYSFDAGAAWQDMSLTGIAWNETVDLGAAQGSRALLVRATDKVGNRSTVSVAFNYDNAPPTLTETGVGSALLYSRSDLAFVGTLKDTNAVANISVSYLKQGDSIPVSLLDQAKTGSNIDVAWNLAVDVDTDGAALGDTSGLNDGNYVFTITARDAAGKTAVLTRNVIIDATAPDLPLFTSVQGPYLTSSLSVAGTASDTTSGVSKLYYRIDTAASTPVPTGTNNWFLNLNIGSSGLNLAEGPHTIYVWSEDKAGNLSGEAQQAFVVDRNDPSISVTGYASTEYRSDTFTISGTAVDSLSLGLSPLYATLTKDGVPLVLGPLDFTYLVSGDTKSATWSLVIDKARGTGLYAASIQGVDAVGRPAQPKTISVILDTLKPSLTITEPLNAALVEKAAYSAQGTATDSGGSGVDRLEYSVDYAGDPLTATWLPAIGTASWAASLSLTDGLAKTFAARAIDRAGNISDPVSVNYKVDLANPDLSETAINTTALVSRNSQVDFAGFASDANGLASFKVSYIKDGGAPVEQTIVPAVGTGAWTWSLPVNTATHANDGLYEISFIATDNSLKAGIGKTTTVLRNVTVDSTPPALEIFPLSPMLSGSRVNGKITLQANASDAYGLTGLKYFLRSDASTPSYTDAVSLPLSGVLAAPYTASINTIGLTDNTTYTLWLIARDRAGNDAIASTTLRVEQASDIPTGSISSPLTGALLGADKKVRGFMSDDDGIELGGAQLYARKGNSGVFTAVPIAFSSSAGQLVEWNADLSTVVAAGDGSYELYLSISDDGSKKAGLASVAYTGATQTFFYDVSPPSLSSITASPAKSAYKVGDSIVLEWTATDASGIASQSAEIDSSTANVSAISNPSGNSYRATYTIPGTGAASGNKTFMVIASDSTGRSATRTLTLVVDVDKPTLENAYTLNPSFVGFTPNGAFSLRGTAQDLRGLDTVQIQFSNDGSSWSLPFAAVLNAGSWTYALADSASYVPASGSLHVRVLAQDLAGNISDPYVFSFAVDQAADKPTVAVISPVNATTYGSTVQVSGTAADDDGLKDTDNNAILDADAVQIEYWNVSTPGNVISHNPVISGSGRNATWNYSLSGLAGGSYIVRVRSVDDNGTIGDWSANTAFTVDTGVPILNLATIPPAFVSNAALVLTGTVEDSGGVKFVRARINGGSWILATAPGMTDTNVDGVWDSLGMGTLSWTLNLNLGADGLKTIEVQASDNNDLLASAQRSTTLDATFPVASFDAQFRDNPSGSFIALTELNKMVRITGSVTELNLRETNPIEISIDGAAYVPVTGTFIWSMSAGYLCPERNAYA
ncbi:hypothetical protein MASR2M78_10280 [Treponema sp.]